AELVRRGDLEVQREAAVGTDLRPGRADGRDGLDQLEAPERVAERGRVGGGRDDVEVLDAVDPAPRRAGELDALGSGMLAQGGENRLGDRERTVQRDPPRGAAAARLDLLERRQQALLGARAEALEVADPRGVD